MKNMMMISQNMRIIMMTMKTMMMKIMTAKITMMMKTTTTMKIMTMMMKMKVAEEAEVEAEAEAITVTSKETAREDSLLEAVEAVPVADQEEAPVPILEDQVPVRGQDQEEEEGLHQALQTIIMTTDMTIREGQEVAEIATEDLQIQTQADLVQEIAEAIQVQVQDQEAAAAQVEVLIPAQEHQKEVLLPWVKQSVQESPVWEARLLTEVADLQVQVDPDLEADEIHNSFFNDCLFINRK